MIARACGGCSRKALACVLAELSFLLSAFAGSTDNALMQQERFDMAYGRAMNIPAGEGRSSLAPTMDTQSGSGQARIQALKAEPVVPLNVELHQRLSRSGNAKASTLQAAMASLKRLRKARVIP